MSYIKSIGLSLCVASLALSAAQAANSEQMLKDTASKAISEYKRSKDISAISGAIPELSALSAGSSKSAEDRGALLSVCSDLLNVLYETADLAFDADKRPLRNSESPGGWYSSGTDPENIRIRN